MALICEADKDALKAMMPEVLAYYGVTDLTRNFSSPWREGDRDPSAKYYPDTNLVTDFGGDTVDVFELVGRMEGVGHFPERVKRVAEIVGYGELHEDDARAWRPRQERPRFEPPAEAGFAETPIEVFEQMRAELFANERALSYLLSRGFDRAKVWKNHLGWCPTMNALSNDDGAPLFKKYEPNAPHGFVVIPFMDREATCANYVMLRVIPGEAPPKDKEIRPKGCKSPLFREWLLTAACKVLYVTEGLLDALAMEMLIGKPCLGLGGDMMAGRVGRVLYYAPPELRPKKVILALDADDAGRKAAAKIADDLDYIGIPHGEFAMPEGCKDPNDVLMMVGGEK